MVFSTALPIAVHHECFDFQSMKSDILEQMEQISNLLQQTCCMLEDNTCLQGDVGLGPASQPYKQALILFHLIQQDWHH